jgi:hypothetical protein
MVIPVLWLCLSSLSSVSKGKYVVVYGFVVVVC